MRSHEKNVLFNSVKSDLKSGLKSDLFSGFINLLYAELLIADEWLQFD